MKKNKKVKVLIVDDSPFMQHFILQKLAQEKAIEICGLASDPFEARDKIITTEPDVLVVDINMPRMSGIEFIRRLMPQYPLPVVVISSNSNLKKEALEAGAVAFVPKTNNVGSDIFIETLKIKVKLAPLIFNKPVKYKSKNDSMLSRKVIGIGASTGGIEATSAILNKLKESLPCILIVQHMPEGFTGMYAERLKEQYSLNIKEAEDGDLIMPNMIYIARGKYHMKVVSGKGGNELRVFQGPKVNSHCPSIDVLFESIAEHYRDNAIGILLTGMGRDGAEGLLEMKRHGGKTIAQDEQSSVVYGMPKEAVALDAVDKQLSPEKIPEVVYKWLKS